MVVSIYTSRVILQQLGVDDYGIYNVVGGVVGMFSMFSATFVSASQRFLSYSLGRGNINDINEVFSISIRVHILLAAILFVLVEFIGGWYLGKYMNIPEGRLNAAYIVFHISNLSFIINLISIPYNALIIAKEKMNVFAYVSVFEVLAKLGIVFLLSYLSYDKLIVYSLLLLLISIIVRVFYSIYCSRTFPDIKFVKVKNKGVYSKFLSFSGWNFLGSSTSILSLNGNNLILNYFCGVAINASQGVATQVQSAVLQLVSNFMTAMKPQIIKSYSVGDLSYVNRLVETGSKIGLYLTSIISLPIIFTSTDILRVWLGTVPPYANFFLVLILMATFLNPITTLLDTLLSATGHIKNYQLGTSLTTLLSLPILVFVMYTGAEPYAVYIVSIILGVVNLIIRLYNCAKFVNGFDLTIYFYEVLLKSFITLGVSVLLPLLFRIYIYNHTFLFWIIQCVVVEISLLLTVWLIGLTQTEKETIRLYTAKLVYKFVRK